MLGVSSDCQMLSKLVLMTVLQLPTYSASVSTKPLHWGDALLAGLTLTALLLEFVSDNQQFGT